MTGCQKLTAAIKDSGTCLCVGIDPHVEYVGSINGATLLEWGKVIIEISSDFCAAFKFNSAFFEQFGSEGMEVLAELIATVPARRFTILDAKRGDIGTTAHAYAQAAYTYFKADAVTVNPYMGMDAIEPFAVYSEKLAFVLALTSNEGARDFQLVESEGIPLYERVIRACQHMPWSTNVGFVVGATYPDRLKAIRGLVGPEVPLLIPGIGAQGGSIGDVLEANAEGVAVVNVSRALLASYRDHGVTGLQQALERYHQQLAVR
ncbi:MAG: orotidine-5'-phosphate decarboxylase [Bacteroidota bacterium]|nr:orotidine-5'-phosphate decarboxylase [Candidatus Kapabacteria bacterium]MCS7302125.1 orotidine-5'-phosphate decarboxylase [Candidatus Kapabacteria bacterium]MCX7936483.1 orotidine-5'-phosphate decarboxylase [Chlorobiota bacterium]MDW8074644.1 orotidine-5'-phosphate decarboxylase [Bacteroidota bacterium]MDW8270880.1 orotidine-5'-phosphate decarboxylase [Bacteroidota bacterium]